MRDSKKRILVVLAAVFALALLVAGPQALDANCGEEYFDIYCGYGCDKEWGTWGCWNRYDDRCCIEHLDGNSCSDNDISQCEEECGTGDCGF